MTTLERWAQLQAELSLDLQRRQALFKSSECCARAGATLTGNDRLSAVEQLEIYREQFWLRHTSALLEDFPGLSGLLGQAQWERLVEGYLERFPPDSWTLRELGKHLPLHVEQSPWLEPHALAVDMARLEWVYTEVFDAPDSAPLSADKLAAVPEEAWGSVRFVLNPGFRVLHVGYPVARLRRRLRQAAGGRAGGPLALPAPHAEHLVVYRDAEGTLCYTVVSAAAAALLHALGQGLPLVEACEAAAERVPESADALESKLGEWFGTWGSRGWIVDIVVP